MSTQVHSTHETPSGVEEVLAILTDKSWADRMAKALHDGSKVVERAERPDGGVLLVMSRELPAGVPGFLERFLPRDGRVVQTADWGPAVDGVRRGTWKVEIHGAPAKLGGALCLEPSPGGSRYTIEGEIKVSVPLIGGKAEKFIADKVKRLAAKEAEVLRAASG